ncbi:MAG: hypothetical protein J5808_01785 [Paludibacteraceae bacterium]|nr:hypothetical protein [Paludibacteraceae bacterium]
MKHLRYCFLILGLAGSVSAQAQKFLMTGMALDTLKPGSLHGTGDLAFEFKKSAAYSIQLATSASLIVPTDKHQFRLDGKFVYNLLNSYSNDNKGNAGFNAYICQFDGLGNRRHINPLFANLYASYNYDYVRKLHDRVMAGANLVWQPLQEHEHVYLETFLGVMFSYQNWMVFKDEKLLKRFDQIRDLQLPVGGTINDYYGINVRGRREQTDARINIGCELSGTWTRFSLTGYLMMQQPLAAPFKSNADTEAAIAETVAASIDENESAEDYLPKLNSNALPTVFFGSKFKYRLTRHLDLVTTLELFYDGGQLPSDVLNFTYGIRQGLSAHW